MKFIPVKYEEGWWRVVVLLFACWTLKLMHQKVASNVFKSYKERTKKVLKQLANNIQKHLQKEIIIMSRESYQITWKFFFIEVEERDNCRVQAW